MEMRNEFEKYRITLVHLCERALQGDLSIENFHALWPEDIPQTAFVIELFNDLEAAVEHFPAHLLSGKKDFKLWATLYEAYKLSLSVQLLASQLDEQSMTFLRKKILDQGIKDKKYIEELIQKAK